MDIDVIIVTYNRLEKLKHTLSCYEAQTCNFANLIVVNNHSTDGTTEFLDSWLKDKSHKFEKHVLNMAENLGGSGGFYYGQKYALKFGSEWVYVSDDDAYPANNLIEKFKLRLSSNGCIKYSAICGVVYNDGKIDEEHRDRIKFAHGEFMRFHVSKEEYKKETFEIDLFTYVGTFLNKKALKEVGLCNPHFFIYYDDSEHAIRLAQYGKILVDTSIKINHDCGALTQNKTGAICSWRDFYSTRNMMYTLRVHFLSASILYFIRFFIFYIKKYYNNITALKLYETALIHGALGHLGKNEKYKPGFQI